MEHFDQHISHQFNQELENLRQKMMAMGGMVEEMLKNAVQAVVTGDTELAVTVIEADDQVNRMEKRLDEECNLIIARRQPTASDLRLIMAVVKTITDLERIGDEAEKIGYLASQLALQERPVDRYRALRHLGDPVGSMLHQALDAFARLDPELALRVVREDKAVDQEYEALTRQAITMMMEDPRSIRRMLDMLWVARALERIGDHAKNICEYVVYMVHGKDIRHVDLDDAEERVSTV